ncbi:hypothetical protein [Levilactobacillus brevis]|nr:hypothetical protein [Levilactobacillus brevis]MDA0410009.1 hypothetical protein [Levilactobacillus brevis]
MAEYSADAWANNKKQQALFSKFEQCLLLFEVNDETVTGANPVS